MFKRYLSIVITIIFFITLLPIVFNIENAYAYQNNSYFTDVKVGLTSMSSSNIVITLNGDYTFDGKTYSSGTIINLGISGTSLLVNGVLQNQINIIPNNKENLLTITSGSISNKYMGSFIFKVYNNKILPINILDIENYLKGVVGYEMSDSCPLEALKAQTVAARNYALSRIGWESAKGYDFNDTAGYQVYKGYNPSYANVINAVEQTRGQVLLYNDKLVEALYSAWHGGISENSENVWGNYVPYLRSVTDSYENNNWPNGNIQLTKSQIQAILISKGYLSSTDIFQSLDLNSITRFPSGRVSNINIIYKNSQGTTQSKSITNDFTRSFLALPSNLYTVTYNSSNGIYIFSGKGNGHGLGMSQIGAKNRAISGQTFDQILKFYYQNVSLQNLILKATISSFTQNSNILFSGDTISFNTIGGAGNGYGYLFKYVIKNGANIVYTQDYSSTSTLDYVAITPGNYTIETYVKDKFSISDYDDKKVSNFTVYSKAILNSFSVDKTQTLVGQCVSSNTSVQGGSGSYLYKYEISKDGNEVSSTDFVSDKNYTYIPAVPGNYQFQVFIKDSLSQNDYDDTKTLSFSVYNPQITSVNVNGYFYEGKAINLVTNCQGASPLGLSYKYEIFNNGNLITSSNFNPYSSFSFIPASSGLYTVKIYGKDGLSNNSYDITKQFDISISSKPLFLSSLPLSYGMTNNSIIVLQNSLIKLGYSISSATGYFGTQTQNAVISFQTNRGLTADGVVGNLTYNSLNDVLIEKLGVKNLSY